MPKTDIAKLFQNGRSQAVRLPREFRFEGDRVRVRRVAGGVLLEPIIQDPKEWFRKLDELNSRALPVRPPATRHAKAQSLRVNYLLDTNACIALINRTSVAVRSRFQRAMGGGANIYVSSVVTSSFVWRCKKFASEPKYAAA